MNIKERLQQQLGKEISQSSNSEIYNGLLNITQQLADEKESNEGKKKVYYISAEFLIGKLLSNNMINLGIYNEVKEMFQEMHQYYKRQYTPKVKPGKKCTACSLKDVCLPKLGKNGSVKMYLAQVLMEEDV